MEMYYMNSWCPQRTEEGIGCLQTGVVDSVSCPVDAGNQIGLLQEPVLLSDEPFLQPQFVYFEDAIKVSSKGEKKKPLLSCEFI